MNELPAWMCVCVGSFCIYACAAAARTIRQFICLLPLAKGKTGKSSCLLSVLVTATIWCCQISLSQHYSFTNLPNIIGLAENEADWQTDPLPLGCGAVPAVCYSVALETPLKKKEGTSVGYLHLLHSRHAATLIWLIFRFIFLDVYLP